MKPSIIFDLQKYYPDSWSMVQEKHFGYIRKVMERNIKRGKKEKLYRRDVNPEIIAKVYTNNSFTIADEIAFPLDKYSKDELFSEFAMYHLHGIVSTTGLEKLST